MTDPMTAVSFIVASEDQRVSRVRRLKKSELEKLLLAVADVAAVDRKGVTSHPYLRTAHKKNMQLQERLKTRPKALQKISAYVSTRKGAVDSMKLELEAAHATNLSLVQMHEERHVY